MILSLLKKTFKFHPIYISFFFIIFGILSYIEGISFFEMIELKTVDARFQSRGTQETTSAIAIAAIDEKSIAREGKWIWPRSKFAKLINKLSDAGAAVIGFDVGFWEPDDKRTIMAIEKLKSALIEAEKNDKYIDETIEYIKSEYDYDMQLVEAIAGSESKIVLGYFFQDYQNVTHQSEEEIAMHEGNIFGSLFQYENYTSEAALNAPLVEVMIPQSNITDVSNATPYSGAINVIRDGDGVIRWMPSVLRYNEMLYSSLSFIVLSTFLDAPLSVTIAEYGVEQLDIGGVPVPVDEEGKIMVNYRGPQNTFPHLSITDILHDEVDTSAIRDKIILVGATANGVYDLRRTPFGSDYPGVEIHANIIDSILTQDFLRQPAWAALYDLIVIIISGLLLGLVLPRVGAIYGAVASLCVFFGHLLFCRYVFNHQGFVLNIIYPVLVIFLTYVGITVYKYLTESRQKRFIKNAFSTYMAPSVVKQLMDSPEKLELGGEEREITAFFSDVQDFTAISEKMPPPELVELLNEFLTEMTDIILKHEGTVDKFEGDAIIAFFGAPNEIKNHAEVAGRSCLEMQVRLAELRDKWKSEGRPQLKMRIGLYTGKAVVGNMGSKNRMDYTMMGDTVNTAARLEGVNKVYGTYILVGETTRDEMGDGIVAREIDAIHVVGKTKPLKIYQLLGFSGKVDQLILDASDLYLKGLTAYRQRDWGNAIDFFGTALDLIPDDGPSRTMMLRSRQYKENPPEENWDGCYTITSK